jgi:large-conductance mechanosensitive channel
MTLSSRRFAGTPDFFGLMFRSTRAGFLYGDFIHALITFVCVAAAIFFLVYGSHRRRHQYSSWRRIQKFSEPPSLRPSGARSRSG